MPSASAQLLQLTVDHMIPSNNLNIIYYRHLKYTVLQHVNCTVFLFSVSHSFFLFSLSLVLYCIYCMHEYDALLYGGNKASIYLIIIFL